MLTGIVTFPFYLTTLGPFLAISIGLIITGWLTMFWIQYGGLMGGTTARILGLPPMLAGTITLGYTASCCLIIMEETSLGWNAPEISPDFDWKEWVWNLLHLGALGIQACVVGAAVQAVSFSATPWPMVVGTLAAFPFVLLGALSAEGAWVPLMIVTVLRSVLLVWWAWDLFFLETSALIAVLTNLTLSGLRGLSPWLTPIYAGPLLAFLILIYARLIGRLAGCIRGATDALTEGDEHA